MTGQGHGQRQVALASLWTQTFLRDELLKNFETFSELVGVCDTCNYK